MSAALFRFALPPQTGLDGLDNRAALVVRKGEGGPLTSLSGKRAAWVDPHSVAGHLLPLAHLRGLGLAPEALFSKQRFFGIYSDALQAVLSEKADVSAIHISGDEASVRASLERALPQSADRFDLLALTEETPSESVVLREARREEAVWLREAFLSLASAPERAVVLDGIFQAEGFEPAPKMGYRALYRVAPKELS